MVDLPRTGRGGDHDHPGGGRSLQRLLEPFDVQILGYDPWIDLGVFAERRIDSVDLETLFTQSDVVYVLAAPTASNHHVVSRELMNLLDPADILVVISRTDLVDFEAMTDLILAGRFRAAVDVFPSEPFDPTHRLHDVRLQ